MRKVTDNGQKKEPGRSEKETAWLTAIGIQAADGLRTSDYLWQLSQKHIDGKISFEEAAGQLNDYYSEKNAHDAGDPEKEEADKTAVNITRLLMSDAFSFSAAGLGSLHRRIFDGVYENAGVPRDFELSKREWVLGGDIIGYMKLEALPGALEECIEKERKYKYDISSSDALIEHMAAFISKIWQICPFGEGNTRFTAVFTLLYLRYLGIGYKIDTFKNDSWYFHNALVRANYRNIEKNIDYEPIYLERFFRNLLLSEQWDLRNRYVHVRPAAEWSTQSKLSDETSAGQVEVKKDVRKVDVRGKEQTSIEKASSKAKHKKAKTKPALPAETEENSPKPDKKVDDTNILFLAVAIGDEFLSAKEIMERLHLKGRDNFLKLYLTPALDAGILALLYPKSPRHPRQKYLLTQNGLDFLRKISPEMKGRIERHLAKPTA